MGFQRWFRHGNGYGIVDTLRANIGTWLRAEYLIISTCCRTELASHPLWHPIRGVLYAIIEFPDNITNRY